MKNFNYNLFFFILHIILSCQFSQVQAQDVDIENFFKSKFKVSGNISANTMFYKSSLPNGRTPFTYMMSGNLNISAFSFNLPLFYNITNQGNDLGYTSPFDFTRLSLMPKYKWVKAYIGNATMTFSPYTLNGFPFKGLGLELTPKSNVTIALMAGQLLKAVEENKASSTVPIYRRFGYGAKIGLDQTNYKLAWIGFYAKDDLNSINATNNIEVKPKENFVNSIIFSSSLIKNLNFNIEYALSALTDDNRSSKLKGGNLIDKLLSTKESTSFMNALKLNCDFNVQKSKLGITYERVDPTYSTLGSLYFNNDLENITLQLSRPFYGDKITLSTNLGFQRDNLAQTKKQDTKRLVGAVDMAVNASDRLNLTASYSNFATYTNKKLDQFELINNPNVVQADTLDYRQLSQNASINMTYIMGKKKNQNINLNYNISGQANQQGGIIRIGQASNIQNLNVAHVVGFIATKFSLNSSINYTINQITKNNSSVVGASIGVSKKLLNDKLNTNFGALYNTSVAKESTNATFGIKFGSSYLLFEKHNFNMSAISMFRSSPTAPGFNDLTANVNYSYAFDKFKLPSLPKFEKKPKEELEPILKIAYKNITLEGTRNQIADQLRELHAEIKTIPEDEAANLGRLLNDIFSTTDKHSFKEKAADYLKNFSANKEQLERYYGYLSKTLQSLLTDIKRKDEQLENDYALALGRVNIHPMHNVDPKIITNKTSYKSYLSLVERKNKKLQPLLFQRWILNEITRLSNKVETNIENDENLSLFNKEQLGYFFKMMNSKKTDDDITNELKVKLITFYNTLSKSKITDDEIEFLYIHKN